MKTKKRDLKKKVISDTIKLCKIIDKHVNSLCDAYDERNKEFPDKINSACCRLLKAKANLLNTVEFLK